MAKIGDIVRYLNAVGGGRITRIEGQMAYVDEDGFETPVLLKECVVVSSASSAPAPKAEPAPAPASKYTPAPEPEETFVVEETPQGERLNVMLAFEPVDIKKLSTTTFDAYLVNDSNYYLTYNVLTRGRDDKDWIMRASGVVEPGIVAFAFDLTREDLPGTDRVAVQYMAYKKDKPFVLKQPACVDLRLDTTKFCRLHCFVPNQYFDTPVIALKVVDDDCPVSIPDIDVSAMKEAMQQKARADRHAPRPARQAKKSRADEPLVIDLHIHELVDNTRGLSNADMLNLQIGTFRKVMDENLKNHGRKIIFIHGKGEGVLRNALLKELNHLYKGHDVQDASFREYGFGATQVCIR